MFACVCVCLYGCVGGLVCIFDSRRLFPQGTNIFSCRGEIVPEYFPTGAKSVQKSDFSPVGKYFVPPGPDCWVFFLCLLIWVWRVRFWFRGLCFYSRRLHPQRTKYFPLQENILSPLGRIVGFFFNGPSFNKIFPTT